MSAAAWPVVVLVLAAVVVIAWPVGGGRSRRRALFPADRPADADPAPRPQCSGRTPGRQPGPVRTIGRRAPVGPPRRRDLSRPAGTVDNPAVNLPESGPGAAGADTPTSGSGSDGSVGRWTRSPRRSLALAAGGGAALAGVLAGPVAAVVAAAYATLGARALLRRRTTTLAGRLRRRRLDQLGALAADLRAGLPVPPALADEGTTTPEGRTPPGASDATERAGLDRIDRLTRAAVRLADRTGAPLAELVERIEADMRAMDRGLAGAAAQAAGARATAWLLAGLPLGGVALGYGIGVDPVGVLLHTPVGAACAVGATGLQTIGLLWAERLGAPPGRAA